MDSKKIGNKEEGGKEMENQELQNKEAKNKENSGEKKVQKYMALYMSLGMCFGVSGGLVFGMLLFPDNMALGMCFGLPIGMCIGMALGAAKDKALSANMMEVIRIEDVADSDDKLVFVAGNDGEEKNYRISKSQMAEQQFAVGDRAAVDADGNLVSLESE